MVNYAKEYYELNQFLGYFNQDWKHLFNWSNTQPNFEAVTRYFKISSPLLVNEVINDLNRFLDLPLSDNELGDILTRQFYCSFTGKSLGLSKRQFLERILNILNEPMERTKQEFIPTFIG